MQTAQAVVDPAREKEISLGRPGKEETSPRVLSFNQILSKETVSIPYDHKERGRNQGSSNLQPHLTEEFGDFTDLWFPSFLLSPFSSFHPHDEIFPFVRFYGWVE